MSQPARQWEDYRDTTKDLPPKLGISFDLPPEKAIDFFTAKGLKPTFSWMDMWKGEHDKAFTVAKMMDLDLLGDTQKALSKALAEGKSFQQFKDELIPLLQSKGWWGRKTAMDPLTGQFVPVQLGSTSRLQTIFRTNLQAAYAAGAWDMIDAQADAAPYLMYDAIDDHRTRPEHAEMDGIIRPVHDEFWQLYYPPNGWNCRCGVIQMSAEELAHRGVKVSDPPKYPTHKWKNPRTGEVLDVPDNLDPGWDHNPGIGYVEKAKALLAEKAAALPPVIKPDPAKLAAQLAAEDASWKSAPGLKGPLKAAADKAEQAAKLAAAEQRAAAAALKVIEDATGSDPGWYKWDALKKWKGDPVFEHAPPTTKLAMVLHQAKHLKGKKKNQALLAAYKKNLIEGKPTTAAQKDAWKRAPVDVQDKFLDAVDAAKAAQQKAAATAKANDEAKAWLESLGAKNAPIIEKAALKHVYDNPGQFGVQPGAGYANIAEAVKKHAAELKQAGKDSAAVTGYKKKLIAGHIPTEAQVAAWNKLPKAQQTAILNEVDAAKAAAAAPKPPPAPATVPSPLEQFKNGIVAQGQPTPNNSAIEAFLQLLPEHKDGILKGLGQPGYHAWKKQQMDKLAGGTAAAPPPAFLTPGQQFMDAFNAKYGKLPTAKQISEFEGLTAGEQMKLLHGLKGQYVQPTPPPAAVIKTTAGELDTDGFIQTGPQKGSNPGGKFQDPKTGVEYYIKNPETIDHARNEVLAGKLYELAGIDVPELRMSTLNGQPAVASRMIDGVAKNQSALTSGIKPAGVADGFAADAWLANWDVVGAVYDNMLVKAGKVYRVDTGGALLFRAQGTPKGAAFGNTVDEWFTMRQGATNPQAVSVFGQLVPQEIKAGALRIAAIAEDDIRDVVLKYGPGNMTERMALADKLIARQADIIKKAGITADDLAKIGPKPGAPTPIPGVTPLDPKVAAARKAQQEAADGLVAGQATGFLTNVHEKVLETVKGLAMRQAKGEKMDLKDYERAKAALAAMSEFEKGPGQYLAPKAKAAVRAYLEPLEREMAKVMAAWNPTTPPPAAWTGGLVNPFTQKIDVAGVPRSLAPKPGQFNEAKAKEALKNLGGLKRASGSAEATARGLTDVEFSALYNYSGSAYTPMNEMLRGQRAKIAGFDDLLAAAVSGMEKLEQYGTGPGNIIQRGVGEYKLRQISAAYLAEFTKAHTTQGNIVRWNSFSSGSYDRPFSGEFQFKITPARGHPKIERVSQHAGENEVLLFPGTLIRIDKATPMGQNSWMIEATEVLQMAATENFAEPDDQLPEERELTDGEKYQRLLDRSTEELLPGGFDVIYTPPAKPKAE